MCGNFVLYYLAEYSYISDVTSEAERTSRISIVDGTDYIFTMVGTAVSGVAFATVGYFGIFGAGAVCDTLGVLYVAFVLKGQSLILCSLIDKNPLNRTHLFNRTPTKLP